MSEENRTFSKKCYNGSAVSGKMYNHVLHRAFQAFHKREGVRGTAQFIAVLLPLVNWFPRSCILWTEPALILFLKSRSYLILSRKSFDFMIQTERFWHTIYKLNDTYITTEVSQKYKRKIFTCIILSALINFNFMTWR